MVAQDVYSYNMEQCKGLGGNNIVTVLMREHGTDLQTASDMVGEHFQKLMDQFIMLQGQLPSWSPEVDAAVTDYITAMQHWVIGNLEWSFKTQRYFGKEHARIKDTRVVTLWDAEE